MDKNQISQIGDKFEESLKKWTEGANEIVKGLAHYILKHKRLFVTAFILFLVTNYLFSQDE